MQILDGKNHQGGLYEKFVGGWVVGLLNGAKHWGVLEWAPMGEPPNTAELEAATLTFQTYFRGLVDEWIQTGIGRDGIETPSNRRVRSSVDEPSISLFDVLFEWLGRNMPKPVLNNDGTIAILDNRPDFRGKSSEQYARDMAVYYFKEILESPAWTRIGKCANSNCQKYFIRQRGRKSAIKRGTYCGECKLVGAAERTRISRRERKLQMLSAAAQAWNSWESRRIRTCRAAWVAAQVNKRFGKLQFVCAKWVNQNIREIERLAGQPVSQ